MIKTRKTRKDNRTLAERADDLTRVLTYKIVSTIHNSKYYPNGIEDYKAQYSRITSGKPLIYSRNGTKCNEQVDFIARFAFTRDDYRKILGRKEANGKYLWVTVEDIKPYIPTWLHLQMNFTKHYTSGKSFSVSSYWYIDFDMLAKMYNDTQIMDTTSDYYTQRQHKYIDKVIFGYTTKENIKEHKESKEMIKNTTSTTSTIIPDEPEDPFKNCPKVIDSRYPYFAKDTTSNERIIKCYLDVRYLREKASNDDFKRVRSMLINRSKRSKADWMTLQDLLSVENLNLETI